MAKKVEIFNPPNTLKTKLEIPAGLSLQDAVRSGDQGIELLRSGYVADLREAAREIEGLVLGLTKGAEGAGPAAVLDRIAGRAYHIEEAAGTFGYPLASTAAERLSIFIRRFRSPLEARVPEFLEVLPLFASLLTTVFTLERTGQGGATEQQIFQHLDRVCERLAAKQQA